VSVGDVNSRKEAVVIPEVPAYLWYRGCGPTALGMLVGYYDSNGFYDLVPGDATTQTSAVETMIASQEHYDDYSLPKDYYPNLVQDKSELGGAHASNSIADYMFTSWSSKNNYWGWSWMSDVGSAMLDYAHQQNANYQVITANIYYSAASWEQFKNEISHNRPVVLLVDSDGDNSTDHFVTGVGYNDETNEYAIYDTWDSSIHWYQYREMSNSYSWGVFGFTKIEIINTLSVNDLKQKISVYPNPAKDKIYFKTGKSLIKLHYKLQDILGKVVKEDFSDKVDLTSCSRGMYLLQIVVDNQKVCRKIIKN
jgi:hypothetical protein